jgi:hypothetical protein
VNETLHLARHRELKAVEREQRVPGRHGHAESDGNGHRNTAVHVDSPQRRRQPQPLALEPA